MSIFKERVKDILSEREISIKDFCEMANIGKNTIFDFDKYNPSLNSAIKIADCLKLSLDFLVEKTEDDSVFIPKTSKISFYSNLLKELEIQKISKSKFCKDLEFSSDAFTRWKNGAVPYFSNIILIANYLDIEIEELIGRK